MQFQRWSQRRERRQAAAEAPGGGRRGSAEALGSAWGSRPLLPSMPAERGRRPPSRTRRFRARPFDRPPPPREREAAPQPRRPSAPRPWGRAARGSPRRGPDGRRGPARLKGASSYSPPCLPRFFRLLPPPPERAAAILSAPPARRSRPAPSASLTARAAILSPLPRRPVPVRRRPPLLVPVRRPQPRPRLAPCPARPSLLVSRRRPAHHRSARPARPA